jgi:hypothetical protein
VPGRGGFQRVKCDEVKQVKRWGEDFVMRRGNMLSGSIIAHDRNFCIDVGKAAREGSNLGINLALAPGPRKP